MSINAFNASYEKAKSLGYKGSSSDFLNLIKNDKQAFNMSYKYAVEAGNDIDEGSFAESIGIGSGGPKPKKKTLVQSPSVSQSILGGGMSSSESDSQDNISTPIRPQKNILGRPLQKVPKSFLQKAQEEEMNRPSVGETIVPKNKVDVAREKYESTQKKSILEGNKTPISKFEQPKNILVETIKQSISPKKKIEEEEILPQDAYTKKEKELKDIGYKETAKLDYRYDNPNWQDISEDEQKKVASTFDDLSYLNIDLTDLSRFLKNKTRFFEDNNLDNNDPKEVQFSKNKYLQQYLNDRNNFLGKKIQGIDNNNKEEINKISSEIGSLVDGTNYENYKKNYLPEQYKLDLETKQLQKEDHDRIKEGKVSQTYYDLRNARDRFVKGGTNPVLDMIYSGLDVIGADNIADKLRVQREMNEYSSNLNYITNASGKVVNYKGDKYLVTKDGGVIDYGTKTLVNSFEDKNKLNTIYELAAKSKEEDSLYSGRGYTNAMADTVGNLAMQILLTKGVGAATGAAGLTAARVGRLAEVVPEMASVFGMVGASTYEDTLQQLREAGISDEVAKREAGKVAALTASASAVSTYFMPNTNANKIMEGLNKNLIIKESVDVLKKEGSEGLSNFLKNKASKIIYNAPEVIAEGGGEFLQEVLENKAQYLANENSNTNIGQKVLQENFRPGELLDTFILSASAGSLGAGIGKANEGAFGMSVQQNYDYLAGMDPTKLDDVGFKLVQKGDITEEQFNNLKTETTNYRRYRDQLLPDVKGRNAVEMTQLLAERDNLELQKKNSHNAFAPEFDTKIKEVDAQIQNLLNKSKNAVQEQTTNESVLGKEQPAVELQGVVEGNAKPEVVTEQKETITPEGKEGVIKPSVLLNKSIDVEDSENRKGIVPIKELEDFIGEDRTGEQAMPQSREIIDNLKDDISKNGFKEPIVLVYDKFRGNGEAAIVEGNHRIQAAKELGFNEIPIRIEKGTIRSNEDRVAEGMFPINVKEVGKLDDRFGVSGDKLGLTIRQPEAIDFANKEVPQITLDEALKVDVKDPKGLQKVSNFLDNAIKDIDKFEKENLGSNVPVALAKQMLKAIKALVDGGIALGDAIKKVAKDNKLTEDDVIRAISTREKENELSEETLPGYDKLLNRIEGVKERSKQRGLNPQQQMENVIKNVQERSPEYANATDVQREQIVRDIRKSFGVKEKSAPSVKRLFGLEEDLKVVMPEKKLLTKQIKDQAKGAKDAKAAWLKANDVVTKKVKDLEKSKQITANQAVAVLSKFAKVNMFNEESVERFLDYTEKVFNNAIYAEKISGVKSKLKTAKKNIYSKIGIADALQDSLNQMFAIDPSLIPDSVFDKYVDLVNILGERKAVLSLKENSEMLSDAVDVLNTVEEEQLLVSQLKEVFDNSSNIIKDEEGNIKYSDSIREMLDNDEIDEYEASVMKKYKKDIIESEPKEKISQEEIESEKNELINAIRTSDLFEKDMPSREERDLVRQLSELFRTDALNELDNATLKNVTKLVDNINNGFLPNYANIIANELKSKINSNPLLNATIKAKPLKLSTLYNNIKSIFTSKIDKSRTGISELVRSAPLYYIDEQFGNFKSKEIFNSLFKDSAEQHDSYETEIGRIQSRLDKAQYDVLKSKGFDHDEAVKSNYKMMTYLLQLEKDSNPDNDTVYNANEYIDKTLERIDDGNTNFNKEDVKALEDIKNDFTNKETGNIDANKLYESFNKAEKDAIKTIQDVNKSLEQKAIYTAAVIRGERIKPINDYVHHNVLHETEAMDQQEGRSLIDKYNANLKPSTKAKNLIERTKGAKALNFDVFSSANRGAKFTLIDYHMTDPIRVARKTLANTKEQLKKTGNWNDKNKLIFNAIESAYNEAINNILMDSFTKGNTFVDKLINELGRQGYRAMLAGTGKFGAELLSNVSYVMFTDPKAFAVGLENAKTLLSEDAFNIMDNSKSLETSRFFSRDPLTGKFVDNNILNKAQDSLKSMYGSKAINTLYKYYNKTGKKYKNSVELVADTLVSAPDKIVSLPLWMGTYISEFENITGSKIDLKKIASNDETYMTENKKAIDAATQKADAAAVQAAATRNPFMGILKGKVKADQNFLLNAWDRANNFLNTYNMFEYFTARRAVMSAMGKGSMTQEEGARVLAGVVTRMTIYGILMQQFGSGLIGLAFGDDDEEEKLKEEAKKKGVNIDDNTWEKYGKFLGSTMSSLLLGRNYGNATKMLFNTATEKLNEKYGGFLREGKEYDPYKDAIQYSTIQEKDFKDSNSLLKQLALKSAGQYAPATNTALSIYDELMADPKKRKDAIERAEKRMNVMAPLEVLGNAGLIPLYKDVRKQVLKDLYKGLEEEVVQKKINDKAKIDELKKAKSIYGDPEMIKAIDRKIKKLKGNADDLKEIKKYEDAKDAEEQELLFDKATGKTYKNRSEMRDANPALYEYRFGDYSDWKRKYGYDSKVDNILEGTSQESSSASSSSPYEKNKKGRHERTEYKRGGTDRGRLGRGDYGRGDYGR